MIVTRRFAVASPEAREHVVATLAGAGGPASVLRAYVEELDVVVEIDDAVGDPVLIEDVVTLASLFVPAAGCAPADRADAVALAARGLGDPELDLSRVLEVHLERT